MFRLPVCPHCRTVYHYGDVRKSKREKVIQCYHCKKSFTQSKKGFIVLFAIAAAAAVIVNIMILSRNDDIIGTIIPITIVSVIAVISAMIFAPYFITYKKDKNKSNDK
ncbi:MAG: hypothetical protein J1E96_02020 [Ruminococcus sp.]|nr:hypothetical protein [Ruminococcus sp.]